jgi:ABC-2 type transport system ATP-binding protein
VIDQGSIIAEGTSDELKAKIGGEVLEFRVDDPSRASDVARILVEVCDTEPQYEIESGRVTLQVGADGSSVLFRLVRAFDREQIRIHELALHQPTLDDVFLSLTGHAAEEPAEGADDAAADGGRGRRGEGAR